MSAIFKKEFKGYFNNMTGYVFIAFLIIAYGIFMSAYNLIMGNPYVEQALKSMDFIFLIVIPLLTMNSLALERKNKTDQLLLTTPVKVSEIVAGKFLAMLAVLAIPIALIAVYPLILSSFGEVNLGTAYGTLFSFFLLGGALISIGMFVSSSTESSVISAVATIGILVVIYFIDAITDMIPDTAAASAIGLIVLAAALALIIYSLTKNFTVSAIALVVLCGAVLAIFFVDSSLLAGVIQKVLGKLALFNGVDTFAEGKIDLSAIVYYLSVMFLFGFLTVRSIDKRRWN